MLCLHNIYNAYMIKIQLIEIKIIELGALLNMTQNGKGYTAISILF